MLIVYRWIWLDTHLGFQHVAHEEHHHAGVDLIGRRPCPPARNGLSQVRPDVHAGHQDKDQDEFCDEDSLGQVQAQAGRVVILSIDGPQLGVLFSQQVAVLLEGFSVST